MLKRSIRQNCSILQFGNRFSIFCKFHRASSIGNEGGENDDGSDMKLGHTLYVHTRTSWRSWLAKHHASAPEIWLIYYKTHTGKPRIPYHEAVEEALCYGWIDSTVKSIDGDRYAQRFSPRRAKSKLSELNKERVRRLIKSKKMRRAGLASIEHHLHPRPRAAGVHRVKSAPFPTDILRALKVHGEAWKNFQRFPATYRRIRIGFIDGSRNRPDVFRKRLRYFIAMTAKNKRYGMER